MITTHDDPRASGLTPEQRRERSLRLLARIRDPLERRIADLERELAQARKMLSAVETLEDAQWQIATQAQAEREAV